MESLQLCTYKEKMSSPHTGPVPPQMSQISNDRFKRKCDDRQVVEIWWICSSDILIVFKIFLRITQTLIATRDESEYWFIGSSRRQFGQWYHRTSVHQRIRGRWNELETSRTARSGSTTCEGTGPHSTGPGPVPAARTAATWHWWSCPAWEVPAISWRGWWLVQECSWWPWWCHESIHIKVREYEVR